MSAARGRRLVIDIAGGKLTAVDGVIASKRVRVRRVVTLACDTDATQKPAEEFGRWLRDALKEQKLPISPVIWSLPRGEVVVKTIETPSDGTMNADEIGEFVRLQLSKQTALQGGASVFDHLDPEQLGGHSSTVFAGALPEGALAWRREACKAMGAKLDSVELRASGLRALVTASDDLDPAAVLGVFPGPDAVDIFGVYGGRLSFVRGVDAHRPALGEDPAPYAERVAVEVARTLLSQRVNAEGGSIGSVRVLGDDAVCEAVAEACAQRVDLPAGPIEPPLALIDGFDELSREQRLAAAPHAGLLLRAAQGEPALNFASPWKPVDRSARTRQLVLAGVFGLIILGGLGWLWADGAVRSITRQIDPITKEAKGLKSRYDERQIELGAWRHLDAWARPEVDWLAHLDRVTDAMTPPPDMLLTEISGRMEAAPTFKPGQPLQDAASWAHVQRGTIRLSGLAADRDLTQSLRANLLASPTYAVHARGPETDGAFQLELTTPDTTPIDPPTPASDEVGSSR